MTARPRLVGGLREKGGGRTQEGCLSGQQWGWEDAVSPLCTQGESGHRQGTRRAERPGHAVAGRTGAAGPERPQKAAPAAGWPCD